MAQKRKWLVAKLHKYTVLGRKAYFCNESCRDAFKEDRRAGVVYGTAKKADGSLYRNWEEASLKNKFCAYCGRWERR